MKVKIALVQFARDREERNRNINRMFEYLREIKDADLVCLPENWFGVEPFEEKEFDDLKSNLSSIAAEQDYNLVTGAGYMWRGDEIYDSSYVINKEGDILGYADKMFPSESVGETEFLSDGKEMKIFQINGVKIGIVVCVDAVYPEVSRALASRGAEIVLNPSNIPKNRLDMWKSIGLTRAVENGVFFAFINNTSTFYPDGREVTGHSFVASPNGEIVSELNESESVLELTIDLEKIEKMNSRWGFLERAAQLGSLGDRKIGKD